MIVKPLVLLRIESVTSQNGEVGYKLEFWELEEFSNNPHIQSLREGKEKEIEYVIENTIEVLKKKLPQLYNIHNRLKISLFLTEEEMTILGKKRFQVNQIYFIGLSRRGIRFIKSEPWHGHGTFFKGKMEGKGKKDLKWGEM